MRIAGKDIFSSVSIGIAFVQTHYRTAEELLRDADAALYRAKARGRHRFEVFDEDLRRQVLLQVETEEQLRRGLPRREFEPVFQPIFALDSGKVVGFEALMRWRHPQHGVVEPARFLAQAEESGLVELIDWQVYEAAFALAEPLLGSRAYLGVNVGARHLRTPLFVDTLLRRLDAAGFNPAQLRIEITESALLEDPRQSRVVMDEMRRYGISIALDDFGTGYSSLSYLHQFPFQAIKIDRSFIDPLDNPLRANAPTLLRAIHALGHELGLEVVAEGIETASQLEQVKRLGEVSGQGFLLARPASVHAIISAGQAAS
ncbi:MAG: EAL domain-containing protein, partial [Xanthomonadales bacterium]|nr:EAL domain-containing protein [Xanthomonadales bacterium]